MAVQSPKMMRMRYIKPELLGDLEIYRLEIDLGLPVRIAWVGLILYADREGRFEWSAEKLRAHILLYDRELNFDLILKGLQSGDWIHQYQHKGRLYGHIRSWDKHQKPNPKEPKSSLPDHNKFCPVCTGEVRVTDECATPASPSVCVSVRLSDSGDGQYRNENPIPLAAINSIED